MSITCAPLTQQYAINKTLFTPVDENITIQNYGENTLGVRCSGSDRHKLYTSLQKENGALGYLKAT